MAGVFARVQAQELLERRHRRLDPVQLGAEQARFAPQGGDAGGEEKGRLDAFQRLLEALPMQKSGLRVVLQTDQDFPVIEAAGVFRRQLGVVAGDRLQERPQVLGGQHPAAVGGVDDQAPAVAFEADQEARRESEAFGGPGRGTGGVQVKDAERRAGTVAAVDDMGQVGGLGIIVLLAGGGTVSEATCDDLDQGVVTLFEVAAPGRRSAVGRDLGGQVIDMPLIGGDGHAGTVRGGEEEGGAGEIDGVAVDAGDGAQSFANSAQRRHADPVLTRT